MWSLNIHSIQFIKQNHACIFIAPRIAIASFVIQVTFELELEALRCPERPADRHQTVLVSLVGLTEALTIDVDILCECPCEQPEKQVIIIASMLKYADDVHVKFNQMFEKKLITSFLLFHHIIQI